jgi:hypothetical protein
MELPYRLRSVGIAVLHYIPKDVQFKASTPLDHPLLAAYG